MFAASNAIAATTRFVVGTAWISLSILNS